jgi:hypothetical protein
MTVIILIVAALSLLAGFYLLITGRREPDFYPPAQHKVNIRKAAEPASRKVDDSPPEGLSAVECAAIELEEEDPIDIFLDFDLPIDFRMEAADKLEKESGFKFNTQLKLDNNQKKGNNDCDVETNEESATDEELVPPLVLTGE